MAAAVHHHRLQAHRSQQVDVLAKASLSDSFTMAAPPYLMTAAPVRRSAAMYLSASTSSARLKAGL